MPARIRRPVVVQVVCPSCAAVRRAQPVGVADVSRQQHQVLECLEPTCGLLWVPVRSTTARAA
jgi:hypothetical protein